MYVKDFKKLDGEVQRKAGKALQKFTANHALPGLNLEKLTNCQNRWTIRVGLNFRILLSKQEDEVGEFWALEGVGPHDSYRVWG